MSYLTETKPSESAEDFVKKVTETQGEQWADPQALAKGYLAAQEHIKNLENQAKEMKEDLSKQDYAAELLTKLKTPTPNEPPNTQGTGEGTKSVVKPEENTTPSLSEDDLKKLVADTLTEREQKSNTQRNLAEAEAGLADLFGANVEKEMEERSAKLGMSKEKLIEIAGESPTAFFQLIGEKPKTPVTVPRGTINTSASEGFQTGEGERGAAYYAKLRRDNRTLYYSPKVQLQMFEDRKRLGLERFNSN